ncbi:MAG: kynureninase [Steroidobacter sp.]
MELDASDPLASFREQFHLPVRDGRTQTYLCGHSLGLQPKHTAQLINEELAQWQSRGVGGHFEGDRPWFSYHELLTPALAELTGAVTSEVVAMNSLTVNLHLMLMSFYRPTSQRYRILIEHGAFPSDRYAVTSQIRLHGYDPATALLTIKPRDGEDIVHTEDVISLLEREGQSIATVMLPGVQYLTGFVHQRHATGNLPRLAGWWGHDKNSRFDMPAEFSPIAGAEGWQLSDPPILACTPLLASLKVFKEAGMNRLRKKSLLLTAYLRHLLQTWLKDKVNIITPSSDDEHGNQISLRLHTSVEHAKQIHQQLLDRDFVTDWREPDIIRVAPVPLYNRFEEVWSFANALREIMR